MIVGRGRRRPRAQAECLPLATCGCYSRAALPFSSASAASAMMPGRGRLVDGDLPSGGRAATLSSMVPKLTIKEAVRNNHVSELGIAMFVRIRLLRRIDPEKNLCAIRVAANRRLRASRRAPAALLRWLRRGIR